MACLRLLPTVPSAPSSDSSVCILFQQSCLHSISTVQSALYFSSSICTFIALYAPSFIALYALSEDHSYCAICTL
ncbi:uncharacterized protein DS421_1g03750 [Arachis hypogaea]|nr:uncharacterized protein DS421_1g03750 [Arachis hypogaea]